MLILTRRVGETLMIGDEVTVTVLGVRVTVRIGVNAPKRVSVHREDLPAYRAEKSQQSVTDIVASRCRARRNLSRHFSCLKLPFNFNRSVLTTLLPLTRLNITILSSVF